MKVLETAETKLGNTIELIGEGDVKNCPLIIGVFHGDEPQGKYLIEKYLAEYFSSLPLSLPLSHKGRGNNSKMLDKFMLQRARLLRHNSTDVEQIMWNILRAHQVNGLHFRRQQPIGKYIVDFVCFSQKIIIELDGGQHSTPDNIEKDKIRTAFLEKEGFKVIRIWNDDVIKNIEGTYEYILSSLAPCGRGVGRGEKKKHLPMLFIPCLNPDGLEKNIRTNANGVDLNRNFPTRNWGKNEGDNATCDDDTTSYYGGKAPASEVETKFVIDVIEKYSPNIILTLHAPYKVVNYDGPAREIAEGISSIINYPVEASIGYPTPGSFGTYCGVERNIPTITLELDEEIPVEELTQPVFRVYEFLKGFTFS